MNIREVIARLQEIAEGLPDGLGSEVRVHICNGHDTPGVLTQSLQVDVMVEQHKHSGEVRSSFAIIQGHPHLDPSSAGSVTRPVTMDIDDVVQQWAADLAHDTSGRAGTGWELVTDPATGKRFVLLPQQGRAWRKLEIGEDGNIRYRPGSPEAVAAGCLCDPGKNAAGAGAGLHDDDLVFIMKDGCPVHEQVDPPDPACGDPA